MANPNNLAELIEGQTRVPVQTLGKTWDAADPATGLNASSGMTSSMLFGLSLEVKLVQRGHSRCNNHEQCKVCIQVLPLVA